MADVPESYDPFLGLTEDEVAKVRPLYEAGKLSHFIEVDRVAEQVLTWGRNIDTGEVFIQRRRPFSQTERLPFPFGYGYLTPP